MAHVTALAAARHDVLARVGWDVGERGLIGAPAVRVVVGAERHVTVDRALRLLGFGTACIVAVPADDAGPDAARCAARGARGAATGRRSCARRPATSTPARSIRSRRSPTSRRQAGAWLHIDGAFGLWAAASPALRQLVAGASAPTPGRPTRTSGSTSRTTAGSRSARIPRRSRRRWACARATSSTPIPTVLATSWTGSRSSRAARAASRSMPRSARSGARDRRAGRAVLRPRAPLRRGAARDPGHRGAQRRGAQPGARPLPRRGGDHDARTARSSQAVQDDGTCWLSGTTWQGMRAMRISVSNWPTSGDDVDRSIEAILRAAVSPARQPRAGSAARPASPVSR